MQAYLPYLICALLVCVFSVVVYLALRKKRGQKETTEPAVSPPSLKGAIIKASAVSSGSAGIHGPGLVDMLSLVIVTPTGNGGAIEIPWWYVEGKTCVAAYQAKGAASYAASKTDLTGNGYDATEGNAPTWGAGVGWTFNGTNDYLVTGVLPVNDQTWSVACQYSNVTSNNGVIVGIQAPGFYFGLEPARLTTNVSYRNGNFVQVAGALRDGNMIVAGRQGYRNGAADGGLIGAAGGAWAGSVAIGANGGLVGNHCAAEVQAVAIYSDTLTAAEVAALTLRMAAL